eukprot:Hpha_TRINITY_DN16330_c3_g1::TRINITY_DN16330_c3_g1_i1::g.59561::m.59561
MPGAGVDATVRLQQFASLIELQQQRIRSLEGAAGRQYQVASPAASPPLSSTPPLSNSVLRPSHPSLFAPRRPSSPLASDRPVGRLGDSLVPTRSALLVPALGATPLAAGGLNFGTRASTVGTSVGTSTNTSVGTSSLADLHGTQGTNSSAACARALSVIQGVRPGLLSPNGNTPRHASIRASNSSPTLLSPSSSSLLARARPSLPLTSVGRTLSTRPPSIQRQPTVLVDRESTPPGVQAFLFPDPASQHGSVDPAPDLKTGAVPVRAFGDSEPGLRNGRGTSVCSSPPRPLTAVQSVHDTPHFTQSEPGAASRKGWPFMWRPSTMTIATATTEPTGTEEATSESSSGCSEPPPDFSDGTPPSAPASAARLPSAPVALPPANTPPPPTFSAPALTSGPPTFSTPPASGGFGPALSGFGMPPAGSSSPFVRHEDSCSGSDSPSDPFDERFNTEPTVKSDPTNLASPAQCPERFQTQAASPPTPPQRGQIAERRGNRQPPALRVPSDPATLTPSASPPASKVSQSVTQSRKQSAVTIATEPDIAENDDDEEDRSALLDAEAREAWGKDTEEDKKAAKLPGNPEGDPPLLAAWIPGARASVRDWPSGKRADGDSFAVAQHTTGGITMSVCCVAAGGSDHVSLLSLLGGREKSRVPFQYGVRRLAGDDERLLVGGGGCLACYDLTRQRWLWNSRLAPWETLAAGRGLLVYGEKRGVLYLQRTHEHPDESRRVTLRGSANNTVGWRCIAVDPPFVVGVDEENGLHVWRTDPPGSLLGKRKFGGVRKPQPGVPRGEITRLSLCGGVIATMHTPPNAPSTIHLWDAASGLFLQSRQHSGGAEVAVELAGEHPNMMIAVSDRANLRLFHLKSEAVEVTGDWPVPQGMGATQRLLFAGRNALIAIHERGVVEWNPQALAKGQGPDCAVM